LHAWLRARCSEVIGVDADPRAVEVAAEQGFAVQLANAEHDALGGPYAVIVAGEVIEHVSDVGRLLSNLRDHLLPNGRLLLTTPNPFSFRQVSKVLRKGAPQVHLRHTAWFDPITLLEAAERSGLKPISGAWFLPSAGWFTRWLARRRPYGCESFGLEFATNSAGSREASAV
jgi:2-polyprenyl-3-methyl-5-hydroxy-6-metoxy-1,4-benzoquinol methylase